MDRKVANKTRIAFHSYGVNSRGEVIPVKSFNISKTTESKSQDYDTLALSKARTLLNRLN